MRRRCGPWPGRTRSWPSPKATSATGQRCTRNRKLGGPAEAKEAVRDVFVALRHKRGTAIIEQLDACRLAALRRRVSTNLTARAGPRRLTDDSTVMLAPGSRLRYPRASTRAGRSAWCA